jgi:signal peptidase I
MESHETKKNFIRDCFEWLDVIIISVLAVVLLFTFIFRIVSIDGDSMNDTLIDGERVIISNLFYTPKRGDIVVISRNTDNRIDRDSEEPIIKRVIATEGQLVDIDFTTGKVYVDGQLLDEPYIKDYAIEQYSTVDSYGVQFPLRVEENCVFVMGDNRRESLDSRSPQIGNNGQINTKYILGRAILRVYPFNKIGALS